MSKYLLLSLLLFTNSVDHLYWQCKARLGAYDYKAVVILNNTCFVRNNDVYKEIETFFASSLRSVPSFREDLTYKF